MSLAFFLLSGLALFQYSVIYLSGISQVEVFQESILGIFGAKLKNTHTY